ncbi:MAG: hypothetical protein JST11_15560 [Acidobacteria bacterium]|nr:hypothetical protein [Acidobacteriota bacterium]
MSSISKVGAAVAAILIVSSWRVAHAQPREINSQKQTWPVKPFDPNTGVQPAGFKGHNPVTVAALAAALKGKLKKSEYETRDEWQHRLDAFRHAKITPLLTVDNQLLNSGSISN